MSKKVLLPLLPVMKNLTLRPYTDDAYARAPRSFPSQDHECSRVQVLVVVGWSYLRRARRTVSASSPTEELLLRVRAVRTILFFSLKLRDDPEIP